MSKDSFSCTLARVLSSAALLTICLSAGSREAFAAPITFDLQNVTFQGGGSLSGSVTIDPAGPGGPGWPISFNNIVTVPGASSLPSLTFNGSASFAPNQVGYDPGYLSMWLYTGSYNLQLSIPYADSWTYPAPLSVSPQNYALNTDQDTNPYTGSRIFYCNGVGCENGMATFNITGGTLEPIRTSPEPASMLLMGTVMLGAGVRRWRQKRA